MISIGDDVIIDVEDGKGAVGQIQGLYNDNCQDEPYRAVIHWYYKAHELPSKVQDKIRNCLSEQYELFWPVGDDKNLRGCIDDIDAETIKQKCLVILLPSSTKNRASTGKYFLRFGFTFDHKLVSDSELLIHLSFVKQKFNEQLNSPVGIKTRSRSTPKTDQGMTDNTC